MDYLNANFIGFTLDIIGKILVAYTAIAVHTRFWREHKVDEAVFKAMKNERWLAVIGIVLMIIGYVLQVPGKI